MADSLHTAGITVVGQGVTRNADSLIACRFLEGMCEAGFVPGCAYLIGSYYKKDEFLRRYTVFFSAAIAAGAFNGVSVAPKVNNLLLTSSATRHADLEDGWDRQLRRMALVGITQKNLRLESSLTESALGSSSSRASSPSSSAPAPSSGSSPSQRRTRCSPPKKKPSSSPASPKTAAKSATTNWTPNSSSNTFSTGRSGSGAPSPLPLPPSH